MSQAKLHAYRWWCGDEICDCTQYVIERLTPRLAPSWFHDIERLWEGKFVTASYELEQVERATLLREFRNAARRHAIRLTRQSLLYSWSGDRLFSDDREPDAT